MRRRFTEEQIIGNLREREAEASVKEITRCQGISEQSFLSLEVEVRRHGSF